MPDPRGAGSGITRRQVLRLAGLGLVAGSSLDLLAACGGGSSPKAASDPSRVQPFLPSTHAPRPTGLPRRVAWASTADSEFFLALGQGMRLAAEQRGFEYVTATSGNDPTKHVAQLRGFLT